jgi:hypothetical protein
MNLFWPSDKMALEEYGGAGAVKKITMSRKYWETSFQKGGFTAQYKLNAISIFVCP